MKKNFQILYFPKKKQRKFIQIPYYKAKKEKKVKFHS